jgi:hypothetical protein
MANITKIGQIKLSDVEKQKLAKFVGVAGRTPVQLTVDAIKKGSTTGQKMSSLQIKLDS